MARTNELVREPAADEGEGYDVLLMSDAFRAAEALALGKVKIYIVLLDHVGATRLRGSTHRINEYARKRAAVRDGQ